MTALASVSTLYKVTALASVSTLNALQGDRCCSVSRYSLGPDGDTKLARGLPDTGAKLGSGAGKQTPVSTLCGHQQSPANHSDSLNILK